MGASDERRRQAVRRRLARVRRRLDLPVWLGAFGLMGWPVAVGCVGWHVFLAQHFRGAHPVGVAVIALAVLLTGSWLLARRRLHSEVAAAVVADDAMQLGGLLLTRLERPLGEWELTVNQHLARLTLPAVDVRQALRQLAPPLLFLGVGLALPHLGTPSRPPNAAAAARVEQVRAMAETLSPLLPLDEALQTELAQLEKHLASGAFDAADWEATDALQARLEDAAATASSDVAKAQALTEALAAAQGSDATARAQEALEQALMAMGGEPAQAGAGLAKPSGSRDLRTSSGDGGQPGGAAASGNGASRSSREARLAEIKKALDARQQQLANARGEGRSGAKPGSGAPSPRGAPGHASRGVKPGNGSGHGAAPPAELVFGGAAEVDPERLRLQTLPKGQGGDEPHELVGLRAADPSLPASGTPVSPGGSLPTGATATHHDTRLELPRNRALVKRYFDAR